MRDPTDLLSKLLSYPACYNSTPAGQTRPCVGPMLLTTPSVPDLAPPSLLLCRHCPCATARGCGVASPLPPATAHASAPPSYSLRCRSADASDAALVSL